MSISTNLQQLAAANQFDIDLANLYCAGDNSGKFNDKVIEAIQQEEIIYYSNAMEYLSKEDASLSQSLEIASDLGYTTENLNSELLATLLYQSNLMDQWSNISTEAVKIFMDEAYLDEIRRDSVIYPNRIN